MSEAYARRPRVEANQIQAFANEATQDVLARCGFPEASSNRQIVSELLQGQARFHAIKAPAGYGKTSLCAGAIRDALASNIPVLAYSSATGRLVEIDESGSVRRSATTGELPEAVAAWLTNSSRGVAVLDSWDKLEPDSADYILQELLKATAETNSSRRVIVTARTSLRNQTAPLRAAGWLREIGVEELRLDPSATKKLLEEAVDEPVTEHRLAQFMQLTEGWPLGIAAALGPLRRHGLVNGLLRISNNDVEVNAALGEQFGLALAPDHFARIARLATFQIFNRDMAREVLGEKDFDSLLSECLRQGLPIFISPEHPAFFRVQGLFRQFLRQRDDASAGEQHAATTAAAIKWFTQRDLYEAAYDCAMQSQQWTLAAEILDRYCESAYVSGQGRRIAEMSLALPRNVLTMFPKVLAFAARCSASWWRYGLANDLVKLFKEHSQQGKNADADETTASQIMHAQMLALQFEDKQPETEKACHALLDRLEHFDSYTRGTIYGSLLYAQREQFNFKNVGELESAAAKQFKRSESACGLVWHGSVVGPTRAMLGNIEGSIRALEDAYSVARNSDDAEWLASAPAAHLAELRYERNEIDAAEDLLRRNFPRDTIGFIDQHISAFVTSARLLWLKGQTGKAVAQLDAGLSLAERHALERFRIGMTTEKLRLLLVGGNVEDAYQLGCAEIDFDPARRPAATQGVTTTDETLALAWVRLAAATGEAKIALEVSGSWKRFLEKCGAIRHLITWEIERALIYASTEQQTLSQRALRSALAFAVGRRIVRPFLDQGPPLLSMLQVQHRAAPVLVGDVDMFVDELLALQGATSDAGTEQGCELTPTKTRLSDRQIEILQMASGGLLNKEIGRRVGMTEASVKWHLQQIYDLIGVRRRAGAYERAKAIGLF